MRNNTSMIKSVLTMLTGLILVTSSLFASELQKVSIRVDGLACPFCAYGLEKKLKRLEGVERLEIKINDGLVILHFKADAKVDQELIMKKVKEAGFTPREIKVEDMSKKVAIRENPTIQKIKLHIEGMACEGCVKRVETALTKLDCVKDVQVNLSRKEASFICTDKNVKPERFAKAVEKLGFKVRVSDDSH